MTIRDHSPTETSKTPYARPELVMFGSVRNATGGSTGSATDNGVMNAKMEGASGM